MKKKYSTPSFETYDLYIEGKIAINVNSGTDSAISSEDDYFTNKKKPQTDIWGNEPKGIWD